jgi:hypothetical protein
MNHRFVYMCMSFLSIFCMNIQAQTTSKDTRPRIVVTADPELDDLNSLIRFLLYSSDFRVEGLVYASSQFHWKGDGKGTKWFVDGREYTRFGLKICPCESWRWNKNERFIHEAVEAYKKVYSNLKIHNSKYPSPSYLKSKIRYGNIEFDGDISKDSEGSNLIKSLMLDNQPGPLFITAWGGQSTIARALKAIEIQYKDTPEWVGIKAKISKKVVLLPSGDQDDTYAKYIKPNWPDIDYRQFSGGPNYSYGAQLKASSQDSLYLTSSWMKQNVTSRGAMGALYRVWGDGKQMVKDDIFDYFGLAGYTNEQLKQKGYIVWMPMQEQGSWLGEGDTGTFMNILNNGLRAYESASYGGWGGQQTNQLFNFQYSEAAASDTSLAGMMSAINSLATKDEKSKTKAFPNFFPMAQRDFATRLQWSVTPQFGKANHEPKVTIKGRLNIKASPSQTVELSGQVTDPDGDSVSIKWWQFGVGTYPKAIKLINPDSATIRLTIPADARTGQTIHLILEATDNGSPTLTRYQRVVIEIL